MAVNPDKNVRWMIAIRWLAGASSLLYVLSRFIPCLPPDFHALIDVSWSQSLHVAFLQRLQFGREVVFGYGPWGFLCRGYHPATHPVAVIAWTMLSLIFWQAGWRVAGQIPCHRFFSWLWLVGFTGLASMPPGLDIDARLAAWMVLLLLLHFFVEEGPFTFTQASLVVSLGWLSLVKFTGLMEIAVVVAIIAADNIFRHRRFPWIVPLWIASLLCFWIAAGQHLDGIGPFLRTSWQIATGYTEAMLLSRMTEIHDVGCFLAASALLSAATGYLAWLRHRFFGLFPLLGLAAFLFLSFKHGYVRCDWHEITAMVSLALASMAVLAVAWPVTKRHGRPAILLQLVVALVLALFVLGSAVSGKLLPVQLVQTLDIRRILAPVRMLCVPGYLPEAYAVSLAGVRDKYPLPPIKGGVDIYSWNQAILFAHGLSYQGRPILQSYSAYTPELAELNAAYLRSGGAPANLLFRIEPIDHHFPSLEDGRSWPELLTRYDIQGASDTAGNYLLLSRSAAPRAYQLTPLQKIPVRFGEPVKPPSATNGPIWAEIEINNSLAGNLVSTLYKPPMLLLTVSLRDGGQFDSCLVPAMARSGFLLSPVVGNALAFASLASTNGLARLADSEVMSMTISADTQSGSTACYRSPMQVRFYRLDFPRQDFNRVDGETAEK